MTAGLKNEYSFMKAVMCQYYGPPENLVLVDIEAPRPGLGEVLVDVHASALNFPDVLMIQGKYQSQPPLPFSPGGEVAGTVAAVGESVSRFRPGDRVFGGTGHGGFCEQVAVPEHALRAMPTTMSFVQASGISTTYGTSYYALKQRARLQEGETLLVLGAGGGVGTPDAALATFHMGAAYIVTGSINQACVEAGASEHTRKLLATTEMADVTMAPAADMFEMGVKLQVVKRGTLFPMRANKLYEIYTRYDSIEAIPSEEREKLEKQVFRSSLDDIWAGTVAHFNERDPKQIERAKDNPKRKMALIFRWYLGLSSRWSNTGELGREMDYQIWAGPALGAFNAWAKGSYLDDYTQRHAVDLAKHLMHGAAYLARVNLLTAQGVSLPVALQRWRPIDQVK